jgi:hypothetical protein
MYRVEPRQAGKLVRGQAIGAAIGRRAARLQYSHDRLSALSLRTNREEGIGQRHAFAGAIEDFPVAQLAAAAQRDSAGADAAQRERDLAKCWPAEAALWALAVELLSRVGQVGSRHVVSPSAQESGVIILTPDCKIPHIILG